MLKCLSLNDLFLLLQSNIFFGFLRNLPESFFLETATGLGLSLVTVVTTQDSISQDLVHVKGMSASFGEIRQLDLKWICSEEKAEPESYLKTITRKAQMYY